MDINNDGKVDLVAGDSLGNVFFYKNVGTKTEPKLEKGVLLEADGKPIKGVAPKFEMKNGQFTVTPNDKDLMGIYSKLNVVDYDGDGLLDILIGHDSPKDGNSQIVFYKNIGTAADPKFAAPKPLDLPGIKQMARPASFVVDWDADGKKDMLISTDTSEIYFLRNSGSNEKAVYEKPEKLNLPELAAEKSIRGRLTVVDWNNDGKLDLVVGNYYYSTTPQQKPSNGGHVWLFLRK